MAGIKLVINVIFCFNLALLSTSSLLGDNEELSKDCVSGSSLFYVGKVSQTNTGLECQKWNATSPHEPSFIPLDGSDHNYCRNPNNDDGGVWCYTVDPDVMWGYCNVPECDDDSKIIWADLNNRSASILAIKADSNEIQKKFTQRSPLEVSVLTDTHFSDSKISDVTGSYREKTIFYPDARLNCVVIKTLDLNLTSRHFCGQAKGIRSMTYDWIRQNLYWTDEIMKWVVVADASLSHYSPIYVANQGLPRALTMHSKQQKLFFSITQRMNSKVYATDLSGGNRQVILAYPRVFDVLSLAVDCTDNRLYIADYWGHGSLVISSNLNGTEVKRHYFKSGSKFVGISAYMDFIFMTDATGRYDYYGHHTHSMWLKSKSNSRSFRINIDGEPRGMKVMSRKEEKLDYADFEFDGCLTMPACDHICLPRREMERECVCSMGYNKVGDTGCQLNLDHNTSLIVVDGDVEKVYQLELSRDRGSNVTLLDFLLKVSTLAIDPLEGTVFISRGDHLITKQSLSGDDMIGWTLPLGTSVNAMVVNPINGDMFFHDKASHSIYVCDRNYSFVKELTSNVKLFSDIQRIALDLRHNKIYWTDTNSMEGKGTLTRMDLNGSNPEVLLRNLHWPRALAIDYERNSLFMSEEIRKTVYEIPLVPRQNNISAILRFNPDSNLSSTNIKDVAVHDNLLYFLTNHEVMTFDLQTNLTKKYSENIFYNPTFLAVYDTELLRRQLDTFPNQ